MTPKSLPLNPEQPMEVTYSPAALQRFKRYNRADFEAAFGEQAPPWNINMPRKYWFDSSAPDTDDLIPYLIFDPSQPNGTRDMRIPGKVARTLNVPGVATYQKWVPRPSAAHIVSHFLDGSQSTSAYPAADLLTDDEARTIVQELGMERMRESESFTLMAHVNWNSETRRPWVADWKGNTHQLARLLQAKYAAGVGSPGHWDTSGPEPAWLSDASSTGEQDPRPEIPIPIRPLLPNESFITSPMGVTILREDKAEQTFGPNLESVIAAIATVQYGVDRLCDNSMLPKRPKQ